MWRFNPRARGGRDLYRRLLPVLPSGFNPRARGGRDGFVCSAYAHIRFVSIHAPAGGATALMAFAGLRPGVSIHAPAGGATRYLQAVFKPSEFQSTRPRGARHFIEQKLAPIAVVSIHAPAGGATFKQLFDSSDIMSFNPRARGGRDFTRHVFTR